MVKMWHKCLMAWILLVLLGWTSLGVATGSLGPPIATSQAFELSSSSLYVNSASCPPYLPPYRPPHLPPGLEGCWPTEEEEEDSQPESWDKTFGGSRDDKSYSVQQTTDGGYILLGVTSSYGAGESDIWLIKTDAQGNKQWHKTFGGTKSDWGNSVRQTTDGCYIVLGYTESFGAGGRDFWLIKTDAQGNKQWHKTFGGSGSDFCSSLQQTSDGGYILLGITYSYGAGRAWLIKTDASGNEQWDKTFGGTEGDAAGYSVWQTSDGGYILLGVTSSYSAGWYDFWLIKIDASGSEQWHKTFGGSDIDYGYSVQQTSDGGYILLGITYSHGAGGADIWLIKYCPEE